MSFHGRGRQEEAATTLPLPHSGSSSASPEGQGPGRLRAALNAMAHARRADGRSLGELLKSAITSSLQLIIVVGGLVVFFNVLMELLARSGVMSALFSMTGRLLSLAGFPPELSAALVSGLFEVTLGARSAGEAAGGVPLQFKAAAAAFILSWGGLSVHAQVASILNGTGLRYLPFMAARLVHALLSAVLLLLLWKPVVSSGLAGQWSALPAASGLAAPEVALLSSISLLCLRSQSCWPCRWWSSCWGSCGGNPMHAADSSICHGSAAAALQRIPAFHSANIVFRFKIDYDRCMTELDKGACTS